MENLHESVGGSYIYDVLTIMEKSNNIC